MRLKGKILLKIMMVARDRFEAIIKRTKYVIILINLR
jgi:hypothetical protein